MLGLDRVLGTALAQLNRFLSLVLVQPGAVPTLLWVTLNGIIERKQKWRNKGELRLKVKIDCDEKTDIVGETEDTDDLGETNFELLSSSRKMLELEVIPEHGLTSEAIEFLLGKLNVLF